MNVPTWREEEGGQRKGHAVPVIKGSTSRGAHVRAIWELLTCFIDDTPELLPSERRVRLRTLRAALERSYKAELSPDQELAHFQEEEP